MFPISRRDFLAASTVAAAGLMLPRRSTAALERAEEFYFDWSELVASKGHFAQVAMGEGGNSMVLAAGADALVIDCKNLGFGGQLRREAEQRSSAKVRHVINTHHHADHTGGNHGFTAEPSLPITAHAKALPRVAAQTNRYISGVKEGIVAISNKEKARGAIGDGIRADLKALHDHIGKLTVKEFSPTRGIDKDTDLEVGGLKVRLMHFGPGHTDNDIIVHCPSLNVVHMGDLLFRKTHPVIDRNAGATTLGWIECLRKALDAIDAKTVVVPGHGKVTNADGIRDQIAYIEKSREVVAKAIKDGKTYKDAENIKAAGFDDYEGGQRRMLLIRAIFDEMTEAKEKEKDK